ncbi:MAG: DUF2939 domain-containing protein [Pseudomonadota bacterium]|nr:DUF2939 domain-containing protein [Pseudomonadota bacterium]
MKKWISLVLAALVALAGYVVAGPYLTVRAIRDAVRSGDHAALAEQVDFPALRASMKAQLSDRLIREAGADMQSSPFGALALTVASGAINAAVEVMVNPAGLGALMEGRQVWRNVSGGMEPQPQATSSQPLQDASYRYESLSRFTATVPDESGTPVVFVLTRDGLHWKLSDVRLPL